MPRKGASPVIGIMSSPGLVRGLSLNNDGALARRAATAAMLGGKLVASGARTSDRSPDERSEIRGGDAAQHPHVAFAHAGYEEVPQWPMTTRSDGSTTK